MAGLRAGHPRLYAVALTKTWMAGTSPAMTEYRLEQFRSSRSGRRTSVMTNASCRRVACLRHGLGHASRRRLFLQRTVLEQRRSGRWRGMSRPRRAIERLRAVAVRRRPVRFVTREFQHALDHAGHLLTEFADRSDM